MKTHILATVSFCSIVLGCTTTSRMDRRADKNFAPPLPNVIEKWKGATPEQLAQLQTGPQEDNILWWKTYRLNTCEGYKTLANTPQFPLYDLALLKAYEVCPNQTDLPELPSSIAPWYRDLAVDIRLKASAQTADLQDDLVALTEKARIETNKKKKEDYLLQAVQIAKKLDNKTELETLENSLYKNSPRLQPNPPAKELPAVAMDYRFHREFDKAIAIYKEIINSKQSTTDEQFQAQKNLRQTYKIAQRRMEYITASGDLVNVTKAQMLAAKKDRKAIARYHDAQILFAKTLWTEDQTSQAVKVLNETHRRLRGSYPMDEVFFILGRIEEERGKFPKALEYYEAAFTQPVSQAELRGKITWLKAWNYYKLENYAKAAEGFEQMRELNKDSSEKSRARFWLARSLKKNKEDAKAEAELNELIKEDPLGYYGVMAYRDLGRPLPAITADTQKVMQLSLLNVPEIDASMRLTTEWLIAVDEKPYAEKAIHHIVEDLKKRNITHEDTWMTVSSAYARAGLYLPLFAAIGSLQPQVKDQLLNDHPDLLFPQPYKDIVQQASNQSGVPAEFIYGIIRQESAFDPEARSPVDAFGLMQLLPSVAKQLASKNKLPYGEALDLYKPEVNIPLGAFELKNLMKKYDNKFILAVSGYNANDSAIRGWLKTRFRPDAVEFIEEVPYEETRSYIKLTMRNFVFYQRLAKEKQAVAFPETLLNWSVNCKKFQR